MKFFLAKKQIPNRKIKQNNKYKNYLFYYNQNLFIITYILLKIFIFKLF